MKKNKKMKFLFTVMLLVSILLSSVSVSAVSFTHRDNVDGSSSTVLSGETYMAKTTVSAVDYNLEESFSDMSDMCVFGDKIYVLCAKKSFIAVINKDYTFDRVIEPVDGDGYKVKFKGAQGIYVEDDSIYVCDTNHEKIIILDTKGLLKEEIKCPKSSLIPKDFVYQPMRIVKDNDGYMYVLSLGCFYGLMTFSPENEFMGFYGANQVKSTVLDTFSYMFELLTSNDTKKSASEKKLPYSFVDVSLDSDGFITACTGKTEDWNNSSGQIRKLSPTGVNILKKKNLDGSTSSADSYNFLENTVVTKFGSARMQSFVSIECDGNFIYALDRTYGVIYIYDTDCNLVGTFGGGIGKGIRLGQFKDPVSVVVNGDDVLVADAKNENITVFSKTNYGKLLLNAQNLQLSGKYEEALPKWEEVLSYDSGCQIAYRGLALDYYNNKDYSKTMQYAKQGKDYSTYDLAYQVVLKKAVADNFVWIVIISVLIIGFVVFAVIKLKSKHIKNDKLSTLFSFAIHPFNSVSDIKYKKKGSLLYSSVIVCLFFLAKALEATASGFLFTKQDIENYNLFYTIIQTFGLVALWTVSNWLVCTLFSGKGTVKEVYICTSYALMPIVIFTFVKILFSYFLPLSSLGLVNGFYIAVLLYSLFLICVSIVTVHEYSFGKFILTSIVTVLGMILIVFVIFIMIILLQQFWNLLYSVLMEIFY